MLRARPRTVVALLGLALAGAAACSSAHAHVTLQEDEGGEPGASGGGTGTTASTAAGTSGASASPPTAVSYPLPASDVPGGLPRSCTGDVFYVGAPTSLCPAGDTYYLCDGASYSRYTCEPPGGGWTEETEAPDPNASTATTASASSSSSSCQGNAAGADPVPATFTMPAAVPTSCQGEVYYEFPRTALCPTGPTYFLCDGATYSEFDCEDPCGGWTVETVVPDPGASSGGSGSSSSSEESSTGGACVDGGLDDGGCL